MTDPRRLGCLLALLAVASAEQQTRWSRQISPQSEFNDWVPLTRPIQEQSLSMLPEPSLYQTSSRKRQAIAEPRILSEPTYQQFPRGGFSQEAMFPQRDFFSVSGLANRPLYLQSVPAVPSAPQNFLTDQGFARQNIRFGLSPTNFPLNQGFISQQLPFESTPTVKRPPNPIKFPVVPTLSPEAKPFGSQTSNKPDSSKFVEGYRAENATDLKKKPQSLQKLKLPKAEILPSVHTPNKAKSEREEVQLLYVPLESLSLNDRRFNFRTKKVPALVNEVPHQRPVAEFSRPNSRPFNEVPPPKPTSEFLRAVPRPIDSYNLNQDIFNNFNAFSEFDNTKKFSTLPTPFPKFSSQSTPFPTSPSTPQVYSTTAKPKKLKPHQPPLAIFLSQNARKGNEVKVGDVITVLKNANTVAVLDSVSPESAPEIFIGPSTLNPPEHYAKFDLPYLSHLSHTEKKLKQLPFFVAPLSYHTPHGFAKIPFPAPHVGSVVINANQIREPTLATPTSSDYYRPSSYATSPPQLRQETRPPTTKPNVSFFSTVAPRTNAPSSNDNNYFTFERQTVNTIRPTSQQTTSPPRAQNYYNDHELNKERFDNQDRYIQNDYDHHQYNSAKVTPSTPSTTVSTTSKASTYPNLLETHNPYSINHAFHFSTPSDYTLPVEEHYPPPSPGVDISPPTFQSQNSESPSSQKPEKEKGNFPTQDYKQSYSPDKYYETGVTQSRYQNFQSPPLTTKPDVPSTANSSPVTGNTEGIRNSYPENTEYNRNINPENSEYTRYTNFAQQTQAPPRETFATREQSSYVTEISSSKPYLNNQYEYESDKDFSNPQPTSSSTTTTSTTTTTTTSRPTRGRPRYTTTKADATTDSATRSTVTRRPLRERRPLPSRNKYESTKASAERGTRRPIESGEKTTKKPSDSNENTSKYSRNRSRGRYQYKNNTEDTEDVNSRRKQNKKEDDLAYQRDVLHQNYPVTIQERASTSDIEAITESLPRISSTRTTPIYSDNDNAYSHDEAAYIQQLVNSMSKNAPEADDAKTDSETSPALNTFVSQNDFNYQSRSSFAPVDAISSFGETSPEQDIKLTTPLITSSLYTTESPLSSSSLSVTESNRPATEQTISINQSNKASTTVEDIKRINSYSETTTAKVETLKEKDEEENVVQTTASYNRVRVRPGVVRQYHQASTTDSPRPTNDRKRPTQAVTYRPAFDRRRTTMRIEEIGEDLKTKQVHARPEVQEIRHPVYRPEPTTESVTSQSTQELTTKRGAFRRRRPTYTTTTTETSTARQTSSEVRMRFRGRRPTTEKPAETTTSDIQTEPNPTTQKTTTYSRFFNRQRFNKNKLSKETEDQDTNHSVSVPQYVAPETEVWPPALPIDSFKPINPNDIVYDKPLTNDDEAYSAIITARNEYDNVLISVTPATNNKDETEKKIPDIPPTLEALVEQSKVTTAQGGENMSQPLKVNFESMLKEVIKSLEEIDKEEYTNKDKVTKHKGGEIGEIPPDWTSSSDNSSQVSEDEVSSTVTAETQERGRKRGFWKKVKVRPVTEVIEAAETQYRPAAVNRNGVVVTLAKTVHDKHGQYEKPKPAATTYKPALAYINDLFSNADEVEENIPEFDISKIAKNVKSNKLESSSEDRSIFSDDKKVNETDYYEDKNEYLKKLNDDFKKGNVKDTEDAREINNLSEADKAGEVDLDTSSPEQPSTTEAPNPTFYDKVSNFSLMDYLFGITSGDDTKSTTEAAPKFKGDYDDDVAAAEQKKNDITTTENAFVPDEINSLPNNVADVADHALEYESKKISVSEKPKNKENVTNTENLNIVETTSNFSGLTNSDYEVSTSKSTEISHETEICFRGKCIKTSKDFL